MRRSESASSRLRAIAAVGAISSAVILAACGGSKSSTSTSSPSATTGGASVGVLTNAKLPPAPSATSGAQVKAAQQFVLAHLGTAKFQAAGPAFDIKRVTKPVWLIAASLKLAPDPEVVAGFVEAAKQAGVPYHVCPGDSTTQGNAICLRQAAQAKAGSAIIWSQNIDALAAPLKQARAAGVKVVSGNDALRVGIAHAPQVDAEVSHDYYGGGQMDAAYAVAALGSSVDALCVSIPEFQVTHAVCEGFKAQLARYCASCKYAEKSVPVAQLGTQTGAVVNSAVLSDPKLNFIQGSVDDLDPLIAVQLKAGNKTPKQVMLGGLNATVDALQAIRDKSYQAVSPGQNPNWWGWAYFDAGARVQAGAIDKVAVTQPNQLFTRETFHYSGKISYDNADAMYGFGTGDVYKNGYSSLWSGQ